MTLFRRSFAVVVVLCGPLWVVAQSKQPVAPRSGVTLIQLAHDLLAKQPQQSPVEPNPAASWNTRAGKDRPLTPTPSRGPQLPSFVGDDRFTRGHVNTADCKPGCACVAVRNIPGIISNQSDLDKKTKPKR